MFPAINTQFERTCSLVSVPERKRNPILDRIEKKIRATAARLKEIQRERSLRAYNSEGQPYCLR